MKQTKAQRAILKYLKKNHPEKHSELIFLLPTHKLCHPKSKIVPVFISNDPDFINLLEHYTHFLDKYGSKADNSIRMRYVFSGIEEDYSCRVCGTEILLRCSQDFSHLRHKGVKFCSPRCSSKDPEVIAKNKSTCFENSGYDHPFRNPAIIAKVQQKCFEETGFLHRIQNPKEHKRWMNSYQKKTGYAHPLLNPASQEKKRNRSMEKRGFSHHLQDPRIMSQSLSSMSRRKDITIGSKSFVVTGYEPQALLYMVNEKGYSPEEIYQTNEFDYCFPYKFLGKIHHYHPDFFIPSDDRIVEVKSIWTMLKDDTRWKEFQAKRKCVLSTGTKFSLLLMFGSRRLMIPEYMFSKSRKAMLKYIRKNRPNLKNNLPS